MIKILVTDGISSKAKEKLESLNYEVVEQFYEKEKLLEEIKKYNCIVVRSATKIRKDIIDAACETNNLKLIIRGGVGVDNIDVSYAESKGITVRNTPCASTDSVAECTIGHMFSLARFIGISNYEMRNGKYPKKEYKGIELANKTLGLIGMGRIAKSVAKKASALGMNIIYFDKYVDNNSIDPLYKSKTKEEVLKESDFVSIHIPMPEDKKPIISKEDLKLMKKSAYILNLSRGGIIDEDALCEALDDGIIAGAALDVYKEEPINNQKILNNKKISITPHIGGSTKEAQDRIGLEIINIIEEKFK